MAKERYLPSQLENDEIRLIITEYSYYQNTNICGRIEY